MTTKLEAINDMLSCIGQAPLSSLEGTKSYFTIAALNLLDSETKRFQLQGWDFNSEDDYKLIPDTDGVITIPDNILMVRVPTLFINRYVVRSGKIYDKRYKTFKINNSLRVSVVFYLEFEDLPEVAKTYAKMCSAYKFVKRELGSDKVTTYTQEDLAEARVALEQHELELGEYTMIPDMYNGNIRSAI